MKIAFLLNNSHSETELVNEINLKFDELYTIGKNKPFTTNKITKHYNLDYRNYKKIKKLTSKRNSITLPGANDYTLFTLAKLKSKLVDTYDVIKTLHVKSLFRKFIQDIKVLTKEDIHKKSINFPILAKPVMGHGGKDIVYISSLLDLKKKFFKLHKNYIFEEFIGGTDHGIFTLIKNKKIIFKFFDTEQRYLNPFTVSSTINICDIPVGVKKKITFKVNQIVKQLNLKDGILHLQIKYNKKNKKFYIIEITRRLPGDNYLSFVKYSTGINVAELILKLFLKNKIKHKNIKRNSFILRKVLMAPRNGKFKKISISKILEGKIVENRAYVKKNFLVTSFFQQRIGVVFFKFENKKNLLNITKNIDKYVKVIMK